MTPRVLALVAAGTLGAGLLISACSSGSGTPQSSQEHKKPHVVFAVGADPCQLVTLQDISGALHEQMAQQQGSKSTCRYVDAKTGSYLSVSTAATTRVNAERAVASAQKTAGVKVQRLSDVGDAGIAYETSTKAGNVATCVIAKNGTILFMYGRGQDPAKVLSGMITLAKTATQHL